jgi:hypothetical protein
MPIYKRCTHVRYVIYVCPVHNNKEFLFYQHSTFMLDRDLYKSTFDLHLKKSEVGNREDRQTSPSWLLGEYWGLLEVRRGKDINTIYLPVYCIIKACKSRYECCSSIGVLFLVCNTDKHTYAKDGTGNLSIKNTDYRERRNKRRIRQYTYIVEQSGTIK